MTLRQSPAASPMRNVIWNWVTFVFGIAVTFALSPFVVRHLGNTDYGIWILLASLVGYLGLLDFGVRGAVTRYIAKLHSEASDAEASRLASTALIIFSAMGLVAILVTGVFAGAIVDRFHIAAAEVGTARLVVLLGGLSVAATLAGGAFGGVIIGLQRFDLSGQIEIAIGVIRAVAIYGALTRGHGLVALALIQLVAALARTLAYVWSSFRLYPELQIHLRWWDRDAFHHIFSFSVYSTLLSFSASIILYSDSVVIGAFLPVAAITPFAIAGNLTDYARSLIRGISSTVTPRASALQGEGMAAVTAVTLRATRLATLVILPVGITFFIRGGRFIELWMGPEYRQSSGEILNILTLALVFYAATQVLGAAIMGVNRHRGLVPFAIAEALVNLGLSVLWVRQVGLPGVAWGTTIPNLVTSFVIFPWYARRTIGLKLGEYYRESWLRPLGAMVPFAAATAMVGRYWPGGNLASYFAGVFLALPLAAAGAWLFAMDASERAGLRETLRVRFGNRMGTAKPSTGE